MNTIVLSTTIPASSTANVPITGAGFAPKAAVFFAGNPNMDGTGLGLASSIGFATATAQASASFRNVAARTTNTNARSMASNTRIHTTWNTGGTINGQCSVLSFDSDGITLEVNAAFFTDAVIQVMLLGGSDMEASVGTFQVPSALGVFTAVSGLSHTPNAVLFASPNRGPTTLNTAINSVIGLGFGFASAAAQGCVGLSCNAGSSTPEQISSQVSTSAVLFDTSPLSGNFQRVAFSSFSSGAFALNKLDTSGIAGGQVAYLALTVPQVLVGATSARTDTNTTTLTTTGINPKALFTLSRPPATATESIGAVGVDDGRMSVGMAAGPTSRAGMSMQVLEVPTPSGGTPTESFNRLPTDAVHAHYSRSSSNTYTLDGSMDVQAFGSESITLVQDDADTVASILPYLVLGDTVSPPPTTFSFANTAFSTSAFSVGAFSLQGDTPPPAPAAGGYRLRRAPRGGQ